MEGGTVMDFKLNFYVAEIVDCRYIKAGEI